MRKTFIYDTESQTWQEGTDIKGLREKQLTCVFAEMDYRCGHTVHGRRRNTIEKNIPMLVWCEQHQRFEDCVLTDEQLEKPTGCKLKGHLVVFREPIPKDWEMLPYNPQEPAREEGKPESFFARARAALERMKDSLLVDREEYLNDEFIGAAPYAWALETVGETKLVVYIEFVELQRIIYKAKKHKLMGQSKLKQYRRALRFTYDLQDGSKHYEEERPVGEDWNRRTEYIPVEEKSWQEMNWGRPREVMTEALQMAARQAKNVFGFAPTVPQGRTDDKMLEDFISRPLDMNICRLERFTGAAYKLLFTRDTDNCFGRLCAFLRIPHSKSLRKAYLRNPWNVVRVKVLMDFGFSDINILQRFFDKPFPLPLRLDKLQYYRTTDIIECWQGAEGARNYREEYHLAKSYVQFLLRNKKEGSAAKLLLKPQEKGTGQDALMVKDSLMMLDKYGKQFSDGLQRKVLRDGLTRAVHDAMGKEAAKLEYGEHEIHYETDPYSCAIAGYNFRLVHNTMDLYDIGNLLNNCVATYAGTVLEGGTKIVSVDRNGAYCACLELAQDRYLCQAKAMSNSRPQGELNDVILFWVMKRRLLVYTRDLFDEPGQRAYVNSLGWQETAPGPKLILALCSAIDILKQINQHSPAYCYTQLLMLLNKDEEIARRKEENGAQYADELQRFLYLFPLGKGLMKEGARGNALAQAVLGYLYNCDKFFPRHTGWSIFWYKRAAESGEVTAMLHLAELYLELKDTQQATQWGIAAVRRGYEPAKKWCAQHKLYYEGCA